MTASRMILAWTIAAVCTGPGLSPGLAADDSPSQPAPRAESAPAKADALSILLDEYERASVQLARETVVNQPARARFYREWLDRITAACAAAPASPFHAEGLMVAASLANGVGDKDLMGRLAAQIVAESRDEWTKAYWRTVEAESILARHANGPAGGAALAQAQMLLVDAVGTFSDTAQAAWTADEAGAAVNLVDATQWLAKALIAGGDPAGAAAVLRATREQVAKLSAATRSVLDRSWLGVESLAVQEARLAAILHDARAVASCAEVVAALPERRQEPSMVILEAARLGSDGAEAGQIAYLDAWLALKIEDRWSVMIRLELASALAGTGHQDDAVRALGLLETVFSQEREALRAFDKAHLPAAHTRDGGADPRALALLGQLRLRTTGDEAGAHELLAILQAEYPGHRATVELSDLLATRALQSNPK